MPTDSLIALRELTSRLNESTIALREAEWREKQLKLIAEALPQVVWSADPDGNLDYYNGRWVEYTGMTVEETKGWGWQPVLHPDDLQRTIDFWNNCVMTGEPYEIEYRWRRYDGEYRWFLGRATPVRNQFGHVIKWIGTGTDIDDHKRAIDKLKSLLAEIAGEKK